MNEFFKKSLEQIRTMWDGLKPGQKASLVLLLALFAVSVVWIVSGSGGDDMVVLLGAEEGNDVRSGVKKELDAKSIKYEVRNDAIYVHRIERDKVRLDLAGAGLFSDDQIFDWLKESSISRTSVQFNKEWQVTIQKRLGKFISSIEAVKSASVQITPASEASGLGFNGPPAKAAVVISLRPGKKLIQQNVLAIAKIVSASVSGLKTSNVAIMDTMGGLYRLPNDESDLSGAADRIDLESKQEKTLKDGIMSILAKFVKDIDDLEVIVKVAIESKSITEKKLQILPGVEIEATESLKTENGATNAGTSDVKREGSVSLNPESATGKSKREESSSAMSQAGRQETNTISPAGDIKNATAAVVMRFYKDDQGVPQGIKDSEIGALASKASNIPAENIKVSMIELPNRPKPEAIEVSTTDRTFDLLEKYGGQILLLLLVLFSLFFIYRIVRKTVPADLISQVEQMRRKVAVEVEVGASPMEMEAEADGVKVTQFKESVKEMVQKNPHGVATLVKKWSSEK